MTGRQNRFHALTQTIWIGKFSLSLTSPFLSVLPIERGLIMEYKILLGLFCALLLGAFAVGALALALGIGSVVVSLCTVAVSGAGLFVVSGLLGE
jgi:hypothetical protein